MSAAPDRTHTHGARDSHGLTATHPLDGLTPDEITRVREVLADAGVLEDDTRFAQQLPVEPPKADMLAWKSGDPLQRRALTTLLDRSTGRVREALVDIDAGTLLEMRELPTADAPYGQPPYLFEEYDDVSDIVKADERWQNAMRARGIPEERWEWAFVNPLAPGQFGEPDEVGKRMIRSLTFAPPRPGDTPWSFPVEGLVALVNLTERRVVKLVDERQVPVPDLDANFDDDSVSERRTSLKPLEITMPEGPSFAVEGSHVTWENWDFRVGFTQREGLVLHQMGWRDNVGQNPGERRSVLHRASVPEMVVPYGDTSECRRWISYFDAGEYHLGKNANPLELGCDCLGVIHYFDGHVASDTGEPFSIPRAVCMHEEDYGLLWKHTEVDGKISSRRSRRLVISFFATIGNYDYGFFWYLYLDGSIQFEAKATGVVFCGADEPGIDHPHATEIAPGLFAPVHQHIFCARLDFDIDGVDNYVEQSDAVRIPMEEKTNRWGNAFTWRRDRVREAGAHQVDPAAGRTWHIGSASRTNAVGRNTEYQLIPEAHPTLLMDPHSTVHARAAFATEHLWVTSYQDGEIFPAGMYPNQHTGGGLPDYVQRGGEVDGNDVVVWHSFGFTHIPRPEDWPVMPVDYTGFWLKPYGFLDRNPSLDVPAVVKADGGCCSSDGATSPSSDGATGGSCCASEGGAQ